MAISRIADNIYAVRFITLFSMPFRHWRAYRHGVIDDKGAKLREPESPQEKAAWTLTHRVISTVKRTIGRLPGGAGLVFMLSGALAVMRESRELPLGVDPYFISALNEAVTAGVSSGPGGETSGSFVRPGLNQLFGTSNTPRSMDDWIKARRKKVEAAKWYSGIRDSLKVMEAAEDIAPLLRDEEELDEFIVYMNLDQ